jgi:hypothetical protein
MAEARLKFNRANPQTVYKNLEEEKERNKQSRIEIVGKSVAEWECAWKGYMALPYSGKQV